MNASNRRSSKKQRIAKAIAPLFSASLIGSAAAADVEAPASATGEKAPALEKKASESSTDYRNWFDVSVGGVLLQGNKAQYQHRSGLPGSAFGGVENFHYEQDVGKKGIFQIDGRGIFDNHDYSLKLELSNPDIGYLKGGYSEFRSWYDGSGGYFPRNGQWFSLYDDELAVNRSEAWFEGGLTLPNKPEFTFKYRHLLRDGQKDSTSWGDSNLTGGLGTRAIVPTFWDINEKRDIFEGDIKHTVGKTDLGLGVRYEISSSNDSRNIHRRPGETAVDRFVTQREGIDSDIFNVHAYSETRLTEKALVTMGYSFTTMDTDISGSRIYGADYDPLYDPLFARRQFHDEGFLNLGGGSQMKQHVGNFNLMLTPWESFTIVPSLRVEKQDQNGIAEFTETDFAAAPTFKAIQTELENLRERGFLDVTEGLEARYTGFKNWTLYARGELLEGDGDLNEREMEAETGLVSRETDSTRFTQKYVAGANWYPLRRLNMGGQYYHKVRENRYDNILDSTPNTPPSPDRYPAFLRDQDFKTDDLNYRVTWRPMDNVTLITRYDYQLSTVDTRADFLAKVQSAEMTSHILSESVTWSPLSRLYLQGSINYVWDKTSTPAALATGSTNLVLNFDNNYWNASASVGYALTEKTDLQAQYFYYRADNYTDNSLYSQPYGADAKENGVTAAIIHRLKQNMVVTLKYGFFSNRDATAGGKNDYDAHLVYSSLRYYF